MSDDTSVLFGLEDEFVVRRVVRSSQDHLEVVIEMREAEGACPACGVLSGLVKERPLVRIKDLPASGQVVYLWWHKRRLVCAEPLCLRRSFTQVSEAIAPRCRLTDRLRQRAAEAVARGNRAVSEVGTEYRLSWRTVNKAVTALAEGVLGEPEPTRVLGIDETRARSVRWVLEEAGWKRTNPWMTSFVNADTTGPGRLLGLAPGRSGACVKDWLALQTEQFRAGIELVVIDPSAPYAAGIRAALPQAAIAVDKWHLVSLGNQMLTQVRQRVTRDRLGRRGTTKEATWVNRQMLLTGAEHLSTKQWGRLRATFAAEDPTNEIAAAWAVKERLRILLAQTEPSRIRWALADFYEAAADAHMDETTRLANTVQTWWPAILTALLHRVSNARTEGYNRIIKNTKRVACGFRNMDNYQSRILVHIALTRGREQTAA
jgi:transposase